MMMVLVVLLFHDGVLLHNRKAAERRRCGFSSFDGLLEGCPVVGILFL